MRSLGAAALWYAGAGWPVLPLKPRAKEPLIPKREGGQGVKDATADLATVSSWWARYPSANVGLAAGSHWWALDIDGGEKGGYETIDALQRRHGALPRTVGQLTGSGGMQLLFAPDPRVTNRVRANDLSGLDVRAAGGYIAAPPSIHPETGRAYMWLYNRGPHEIDIAQAPEWLIQAIIRKEEEAPRPTGKREKIRSNSAYVKKALEEEYNRVISAGKGSRNHTLFQAACRFYEFVASGFVSESTAYSVLSSAAEAIGLKKDEYIKTLKSAKNTGLAAPREVRNG